MCTPSSQTRADHRRATTISCVGAPSLRAVAASVVALGRLDHRRRGAGHAHRVRPGRVEILRVRARGLPESRWYGRGRPGRAAGTAGEWLSRGGGTGGRLPERHWYGRERLWSGGGTGRGPRRAACTAGRVPRSAPLVLVDGDPAVAPPQRSKRLPGSFKMQRWRPPPGRATGRHVCNLVHRIRTQRRATPRPDRARTVGQRRSGRHPPVPTKPSPTTSDSPIWQTSYVHTRQSARARIARRVGGGPECVASALRSPALGSYDFVLIDCPPNFNQCSHVCPSSLRPRQIAPQPWPRMSGQVVPVARARCGRTESYSSGPPGSPTACGRRRR
jgi:hypothetical protein